MNVLITGGVGFIGSHIVDKLLQNNHKVIIVDNLSSGTLDNIQNPNDISFYQKDIVTDDLTEIFETQKPDFCIHLAAQTSVTKSFANPIFDANSNIIASIKLLDLCKKYKVKKFITSSTAAVYGMPQYLPVDEKHSTIPISYYGLSKLTMEKYIQLYNIPYVIFRFANVYGPRQNSSQESGVIAIFNNKMLNNQPIDIYGDGNQIRDFVYVEDIANAVVSAIENEMAKNQIINYSTNEGITINELFSLMREIYDYQLEPNYLPEREGDIKDSILSNEKAKAFLGNMTITNIKSGVEKLKKYYTEQVKC